MQLKDKIKELREKSGMNKADLARAVGISDVTVGYWENGKIKTMTSDNLISLAGAFGILVSELLDDPLLEEHNTKVAREAFEAALGGSESDA